MKLVIQIPCWNEEKTLGEVLGQLPSKVEGADEVEVVVVDDGSTDGTIDVARRLGVAEVVTLGRHLGLAEAFTAGVEAAIRRGADVLVNIDADMQYPPEHIADLARPILKGEADIAIGNRLARKPSPFSPLKTLLEHLGSATVRWFSGLPVKDAASGFRAFGRDVLESMFIHGKFSYTLESLIWAGVKGFRLANVPITVNPPKRQSRLFSSIPGYVGRSAVAVIRAYLMYHPLRFFAGVGALFLLGALALGIRFMIYYVLEGGGGRVQSLILLAILAFLGFQCVILGLIGDVLSANRRLLEKLRVAHLRSGGGQ